MRRVEGWLGGESGDPDDLAPFIEVRLIHKGDSFNFDFMIDSGSNATILMPRDAIWLLGDRYLQMDMRSQPQSVPLQGVGESEIYMAPLEVTLILTDDSESPIHVDRTIWVADPQPAYRSDEGNWSVPSLFGRDAIRPGDFERSYMNGSVTLIRPDSE